MHKKKVLVGDNFTGILYDEIKGFISPTYVVHYSWDDFLRIITDVRLRFKLQLHHDLYHERLGRAEKPLSDFLFIPEKVHIVEKLEKPLFTNVTAMSKIEYDFMLHWIKPLDLFTTLPTLAARVIHRDLLKEKRR